MKVVERLGLIPVVVASLPLWSCGGPLENVVTHHNNNARTGVYSTETSLTPAKVLQHGMRRRYGIAECNGGNAARCLDGRIATQPLYVHGVNFPNGKANGLFVATINNKVYGLEAATGDRAWMTDLMRDQNGTEINPGFLPRGVNATPVIDPDARRMYVVFSSRREVPGALGAVAGCLASSPDTPEARRQCDLAGYRKTNAEVVYWLAALNIDNGAIVRRIPITASARRADGGMLLFRPTDQMDHAALLLDHGMLYVSFGSWASFEGLVGYEWHGWIMRFLAGDLNWLGTFCTSVNASPDEVTQWGGSGIWHGGGGPATDAAGNVFFLTGNGVSDFANAKYGDAIVRLPAPPAALTPLAFSPPEAVALAAKDADLGSGGALVIPGSSVVIGGGKTGYMYVLDSSSMKPDRVFAASTNQYDPGQRGQTWNQGPHLHGSPTYWRGPDPVYGMVYVWGEKDFLKIYRFNTTKNAFEQHFDGQRFITSPYKQGTVKALRDTMPGGTVSISADGNKPGTGIVWATLTASGRAPNPGRLYAFNAETLEPLWDDGFDLFELSHWVPPTIADGMVFVATGNARLMAYELGTDQGAGNGKWSPSEPQNPGDACKACHSEGRMLDVLNNSRPMSEHFATGGAMRLWPILMLEQLAPPAGLRKSVVLEGNGVNRYEARREAARGAPLQWQLMSSTADLVRTDDTMPAYFAAAARGGTRVALTAENAWAASDGSRVTAELQNRLRTPAPMDLDWQLLRIVDRSGQGILSERKFVQRLYTHAGLPGQPPRSAGEVVEVPFHAEYWFYR
jgi:outer membrane protein assembly factor BamB